MRTQHEVQQSSREKLKELRRSARKLQPVVKGTTEERKSAALKGYKAWADLRDRANKRASR